MLHRLHDALLTIGVLLHNLNLRYCCSGTNIAPSDTVLLSNRGVKRCRMLESVVVACAVVNCGNLTAIWAEFEVSIQRVFRVFPGMTSRPRENSGFLLCTLQIFVIKPFYNRVPHTKLVSSCLAVISVWFPDHGPSWPPSLTVVFKILVIDVNGLTNGALGVLSLKPNKRRGVGMKNLILHEDSKHNDQKYQICQYEELRMCITVSGLRHVMRVFARHSFTCALLLLSSGTSPSTLMWW